MLSRLYYCTGAESAAAATDGPHSPPAADPRTQQPGAVRPRAAAHCRRAAPAQLASGKSHVSRPSTTPGTQFQTLLLVDL